MSLMTQWEDMVSVFNNDAQAQQKFWTDYYLQEKGIYEKLLDQPGEVYSGTVQELADKFGMGFSNVGLGIVHSMAHPLGALYDTPHGVANAIILPTVMEYNAPATGDKYKYIAQAMGVEGTENMTQEEYRKAAVDAVRKLSADVGIPADMKEIVKPEDVDFLAQSAFDDACRPGNPRETSVAEIAELYRSLM